MDKNDNLTILGRGGFTNYPDVQKEWTWIAEFPNLNDDNVNEGLLIRCKTISIPQGNIGTIDSNFYGSKQFFASKPDLGHSVSCTFEETEDLFVSRFFYAWRQKIYNITTGGSEVNSKRAGGPDDGGYAKDFKLYLTKYNKEVNGYVLFENAWPSTVGDVNLSYDSDSKVTINVTFTFDRWQLSTDSEPQGAIPLMMASQTVLSRNSY